jgi:hypothetical protein
MGCGPSGVSYCSSHVDIAVLSEIDVNVVHTVLLHADDYKDATWTVKCHKASGWDFGAVPLSGSI